MENVDVSRLIINQLEKIKQGTFDMKMFSQEFEKIPPNMINLKSIIQEILDQTKQQNLYESSTAHKKTLKYSKKIIEWIYNTYYEKRQRVLDIGFLPNSETHNNLRDYLNNAQKSISFTILQESFDDDYDEILKFLKEKAENGVEIRVLIINNGNETDNTKHTYLNNEDIISNKINGDSVGLDIRIYKAKTLPIQDIFTIIDDKYVLIGPYDQRINDKNHEYWDSMLLIDDKYTVEKYQNKFDEYWMNYLQKDIDELTYIESNDFKSTYEDIGDENEEKKDIEEVSLVIEEQIVELPIEEKEQEDKVPVIMVDKDEEENKVGLVIDDKDDNNDNNSGNNDNDSGSNESNNIPVMNVEKLNIDLVSDAVDDNQSEIIKGDEVIPIQIIIEDNSAKEDNLVEEVNPIKEDNPAKDDNPEKENQLEQIIEQVIPNQNSSNISEINNTKLKEKRLLRKSKKIKKKLDLKSSSLSSSIKLIPKHKQLLQKKFYQGTLTRSLQNFGVFVGFVILSLLSFLIFNTKCLTMNLPAMQ